MNVDDLAQEAREIRKDILRLAYHGKTGHIGSAFSVADLLTALYSGFLRVDPSRTDDPDRDRLILSKGHACAALYAVLGRRGFLTKVTLDGFSRDGGTLEHHPSRDLSRGIEYSTGSLGHGPAVAAGIALALKRANSRARVVVIVSDGELNEGSVWETVQFAAQAQLANLTMIVDCNRIQALGNTADVVNLEPLLEKFQVFGWQGRRIDGHSHAMINATLADLPFCDTAPSVIVADTIKGKGVAFMENTLTWHYGVLDEERYKDALEALDR